MATFEQALVIVPTYNESDNIHPMIEKLFGLYPQISVLIIDDNSPDGTAQIVTSLQQRFPNLYLLQRAGKLGLGTAYITGFKWALERKFEFIFEMDCDFSHDPQELQNFLEAIESADLVIGSRYINGIRICNWSMGRLLLSYCASIYVRLVTGIPVEDTTGGFKCFRRKVLEGLNFKKIQSNGYSFQIELNYLTWAKGYRVKEIPITFYERRLGESKMGKNIVFEALFMVVKLRIKNLLGIL